MGYRELDDILIKYFIKLLIIVWRGIDRISGRENDVVATMSDMWREKIKFLAN